MTTTRAVWRWVAWALILTAVTLLLLGFRARLDKAHVALLYLLVVLAGSVSGGRQLGLVIAGVAFLLFDWLFLLPYYTLVITDPLDWLVLIAFLVVSLVATQIVHRLQGEASTARTRAAEVDRFATLGAETLNVARAEEALAAISHVIASTLQARACRIHVVEEAQVRGEVPAGSLAVWVGQHGRAAIRRADGTTHLADSAEVPAVDLNTATAIYLPLQVRGRMAGVLALEYDHPFDFGPGERRFLTALEYYAALAVERVRLAAEADHAEALREAGRLKDALLASVSHDLRTPLTTIKALAHDMAREDERARAIEEEADRLNRLVANLLDLSRLQGGALSLSIALNPVDELVGAALQRVSGALGGRPLEVHLEEGAALLVGRFDFAHTLRILVNLIENAHKYAQPGTPVDFSIARLGDRIQFSVSDRGPGVPAAERQRIFEPFYRPAGSLPDVGGVGLGLSIARKLAEAQQGSVEYQPRPGGGSIFMLSLPAVDLIPPPDFL